MTEIRRRGGFLLVTDTNGRRHALRLGAVAGLSDADDDRQETVVQFQGGRYIVVPMPLDEVFATLEGVVGPGGALMSPAR